MTHLLSPRTVLTPKKSHRYTRRPLSLAMLTLLTIPFINACNSVDSRYDSVAPMAQPALAEPNRVDSDSQISPVIVVANTAASMQAPMQELRQSKMRSSGVTVSPILLYSTADNAMSIPPTPVVGEQNTENYADIEPSSVKATSEHPFATFSIDTDTGSYANVRRFLNQGNLPPADAVRVEELINYFNYDFNQAIQKNGAPFLVDTKVVAAPWHPTNQIIKIGIKAADPVAEQGQPPANLVFMVDVSGSMGSSDKLPLAQASLKLLTKQLRTQDTITLITYAGNTEIVLPPTQGSETQTILNAIDNLRARGSTNGEAAIKLAYQQAQKSFKPKGINRILMLTDGDFNVGVSNVDDMLDIIKDNRDKGISLSTLGFGTGNYNDYMMEQVADNGNGNYSYIDNLSEAKKVLIDEMSATFNTVAKDVKIQIEFNPDAVSEWRLIGYENRVLADEDFANDKIDAGELGAGKSVVALFEITPTGKQGYLPTSRYTPTAATVGNTNELGFLNIRYKAPNKTTSQLVSYPIHNKITSADTDTQFALAVAGYGQLLSDSKYMQSFDYDDVTQLAKQGLNPSVDPSGSRREFIALVALAEALDN